MIFDNINIDTIMRDYYSSICSDKLYSDNINIDEEEIENSSSKYLQEFAKFLNDSYCKGYVISASILKKLMDIIEFEGYEYQIIKSYIKILSEAMIDSEYCKIDFNLSPEDSKSFILEYIGVINNKDSYMSDEIPHCNLLEPVENFKLNVLEEVDHPIDIMYKSIINKNIKSFPIIYTQHMKVIYNNNISAYKSLISKDNSVLGLVFLLDYNNNTSLDILVENIDSINKLADLIDIYKYYNSNIEFDDIVNNNIRRLLELLTINISIEQTAMYIGQNYDLWKEYCDNNYHKINTLLYAVNLYRSDKERFKMYSPVEYIYEIKQYEDDYYFYLRQALLSMDYKLFFENFNEIYSEILHSLDDKLDQESIIHHRDNMISLLKEVFGYYINLRNELVDNAIINTYNYLNELLYSLTNNKIIIRNNLSVLKSSIIDGNIEDIKFFLKNIDLKNMLLFRNGKFDTNLIPSENSDVMVNYKCIYIDDTITNNDIIIDYENNILTGSKITDVKTIEPIDPNINLEYIYYDEKFKLTYKNNAVYTILCLKNKDKIYTNTEVLLIHGEDNSQLKLKYLNPNMNIIIGMLSNDNSFIYTNIEYDDTAIQKIYDYNKQKENNISGAEQKIIELMRTDSNTYLAESLKDSNIIMTLSNQNLPDTDKRYMFLFKD